VADQHERDPRMFRAGNFSERTKVVDDMVEIGNERTLAVGPTVTDVVVGVHDGTLLSEHLRYMVVSATVLGISVNDLDDPRGRAVRFPTMVGHRSF
jgi:hypothetical protein